jgi:ADP-heptose:LPS heptosyltransferase
LGKKTVSFFGPVDPKVYGPYPADAKRHIVLRKELECSPCYSGFRLSGCLKNRECLEKIDIQEAVSAVASLLKTDD